MTTHALPEESSTEDERRQGSALRPEQRDAILEAAQVYAGAKMAHQKWADTGAGPAGAADAQQAYAELQQLVDAATNIVELQQLLDERNLLADLRRSMAAERDELARKYEAATTYSRLASDSRVAAEAERDDLLTARADLVERLAAVTSARNEWIRQLVAVKAERDDLTIERDRLLTVRGELTSERDALMSERVTLLNAKTELTAVNEKLRVECNLHSAWAVNARADLASFKEKVQDVGYRYADKHDWCEVMDQAMDELGLKRDPIQYQATLTITVEFHATLNRTSGELPDRRWVRESITTSDVRDAIEGSLRGDSDHEDLDVDTVEFSVSDIADNS